MDVGCKIYYDLVTGNVILNTGERSGNVVETTREQDFVSYKALSVLNEETVGLKQLSFGELAADFAACDGYSVDLATGELVFSYPDPEEPTPVYVTPLSQQIAEVKTRQELMQTALDELILGGGL